MDPLKSASGSCIILIDCCKERTESKYLWLEDFAAEESSTKFLLYSLLLNLCHLLGAIWDVGSLGDPLLLCFLLWESSG